MSMWERISKDETYLIAEMSANHGGKLENALKIVHAAKQAGANCLKIQTYTADMMTLNCDNDYFRIQGGLWGGRQLYDLYQEACTPLEWQWRLRKECEEIEIDFLSTPFDKSAVEFLEELNVKFYKIASFELVDIPLIEYIAKKGKPILLSCGMANVDEIHDAINACKEQNNEKLVLLKCCSEYPANLCDMNLMTMPDMQKRFGFQVGLSDHTQGDLAAIVGVSLGACIIEKHFCLSRSIKTPDSAFSMEPDEFAMMAEKIKNVKNICGNVQYDLLDAERSSIIFRRSLFAIKDILNGEVFTKDNVRSIRPGYGLSPKYFKSIIGQHAKHNYKRGEPIQKNEVIVFNK